MKVHVFHVHGVTNYCAYPFALRRGIGRLADCLRTGRVEDASGAMLERQEEGEWFTAESGPKRPMQQALLNMRGRG